ncbi:MAG: methyltransferase domain-containing protein [Acidiferrobacterales bacterium]|nr:methyltransferase domain-containing protein [Acidiferrobacterales bacterium]
MAVDSIVTDSSRRSVPTFVSFRHQWRGQPTSTASMEQLRFSRRENRLFRSIETDTQNVTLILSQHLMSHQAKRQTLDQRWYENNAEKIFEEYERHSFESTHKALLDHLPTEPAIVLDIGAGTGRDAAGFARLGHDVVAVEPNDRLRTLARKKHLCERICWVKDSLPKLEKVRHKGLTFNIMLLSAVWMHVAPSQRRKALRRLASLLSPGGVMCFTLRHGPSEPDRGFWDVHRAEVLEMARDLGLFEISTLTEEDLLEREGITWTRIILQSPGDGTGALPLLRGVILNDAKSSTYKLALLRVLVRIAQSSAGLARLEGEDDVILPLGLFALYWLRLYRPLLDKDLPQSPTNTSGAVSIGFANNAFEQLETTPELNFRVGMNFPSTPANALHRALNDICSTLSKMPMHYITYPGSSDQVFVAKKESRVRSPSSMTLDADYLFSFGTVRIPYDLWQAAQKFGAWIEPAIVAEWKELMKGYANRQGREINIQELDQALVWNEPKHTTALSRERAKQMVKGGHDLYCVWSGKKLIAGYFDIDHCFPYSAWPCDDLWNLMPANPAVNQKLKRDKLPGLFTLGESRERITEWWESAYIQHNEIIKQRFFNEVRASLRLNFSEQDPEDIFDSLEVQQIQLKFNQQIPEWNYPPP